MVLYSAISYIDKKEQKDFAFQKLLEASSDPEIDWIIVCYHKPSVTSKTEGGHAADQGIATIYHEMFDHFGADMILTGHNHNYQRTKLVENNPKDETEPVVVSDVDNDIYDTRNGRIFLVIGSGGRKAEYFVKKAKKKEKFIKFRNPNGQEDDDNLSDEDRHGILLLEFTSNKTMTGKFITNKREGKIIDTFMIDKSSIIESHGCGEHEHWDEVKQSCIHDDSSGFRRGPDNEDKVDKITCVRKET